MRICTLLTIIHVLSAFSALSYGKNLAESDSSKIEILFNERGYDTLSLNISYYDRVDSVFLDSYGFGSITLPINEPTFAYITNLNGSSPIKLILDGGFDIKITNKNDSVSFKGIGSEENDYLYKLNKYEFELDEKFTELTGEELENSKGLIKTKNLLDSMLNAYAKIHKPNSDKEIINDLIFDESLVFAKTLVFRELYYHYLNEGTNFSDSEIEKLGIL